MISLEAYRAVIGQWQPRGSLPKRVETTDVSCQKTEEQVIQIYKNFMILIVGLVLLPIALSSLTLEMIGSKQQKPEADVMEPMSLKNVKLLLTMAGIETNPGPRSQNVKEGKQCEYCGGIFKYNLQRHKKRWHETRHLIICRFCKRPFDNKQAWMQHMEDEHKPRTRRWQVSNKAFQERVLDVTLLYEDDKLETSLGESIRKEVFAQIQYYLRYHGSIRFQLFFICLMRNENIDGTILDTFYFNNEPQSLVRGEAELRGLIRSQFELLRNQVLSLEVEHQEGSGWSFECSEGFKISITKLSTKKMGSYLKFNPRNAQGNALKGFKRYIVNVENLEDQKCVIYNIILSKFGHKISGDLTDVRNLQSFLPLVDDTEVEYPVREKDLLCLERNNSKTLNIAINVWRYVESQRIEPYYISKIRTKGKTECNMLLIEELGLKDEAPMQHLIHIKDIRSLFRESCPSSLLRKHTFCPSCYHFRTSSYTRMMKHWKACTDSNYFKKIYPEPERLFLPHGNVMPPPNSYKSERPYLRGFFDFETLHSSQDDSCRRCTTKLQKMGFTGTFDVHCSHRNEQKTIYLTELPAICFSLLILDEQGEIVFEKYYQGSDAAAYFSKLLFSIEEQMMRIIDTKEKMFMTQEDIKNFSEATHCEECGKMFDETTFKCRDHHHLSGKYRGALCNFCNLQKKSLRFIPLYCHNLTGFDSHLILRSLDIDQTKFQTLSRNAEKIITITLGKFKLIDSSSFMPESLESLVSNLLDKGKENFKQTEKMSGNSATKFKLLTRKGLFPYEYLDNISRLKEKSLPAASSFYSKLKETGVSQAEYQFAQKVWRRFKCKTLACYMKLYCTLDVRLLADVWTDWAATTSKPFKIEAEAGFISLPSFAFNCFLAKTYRDEQEVVTLIDKSMIPFHDDIQKGIRGGSCMIKQKAAFDTSMEAALMSYANEEEWAEYLKIQDMYEIEAKKQSKKFLDRRTSVKKCDHSGCDNIILGSSKMCVRHACKTILALDFTNLYGYSMTHKMPVDSFRVMDQTELDKHQSFFDMNITKKKYRDTSNEGFIFCCKLDFPKKVQKRLLSYPLVPEALLVEEDMLSKGQKATWKALFTKSYSNGGHKKMINSFKTKQNYTSHYQLLSFLSSVGVKVTIVRGHAFRQTNFISGYVNFCAAQRKKSTNASDKKLWKNMANIIYGKFIGNLLISIVICLYFLSHRGPAKTVEYCLLQLL